MTWVLLVAFAVLVVMIRRRRARRDERAGLVAERPTFATEPPARRMGSLKDGHL